MMEEARLLHEAIEGFKTRYPDVPLTFAQRVPFQRPFTERLLMSLIWASPQRDPFDPATQQQRLWDAYKAIYRVDPKARPQSVYDFEKLCWMLQNHQMQFAEKSQGERADVDSYRKLAARAATDEGDEERLRKAFAKFREQTAALNPDMLVEIEVIQRLALDLVEAVVTQLGVPFYAYD